MKQAIRQIMMSLFLITSILVVCAVLVEIVGRATGFLSVQGSKIRPSPTKGYELDPAAPSINAYGLRGPEIALAKPPHTFRIVALGDSFTYGQGVSFQHTYPEQLEALLNRRAGAWNRQYESINAAVSGYNTYQELIHLKEVGLRFNPDMILVSFTLGDADLGYFGLKNPKQSSTIIRVKEWAKKNIGLYNFVKLRLKRLINKVQSIRHDTRVGGAEVLPLQLALQGKSHPGWELLRQSLSELGAIAHERNIPAVLVIYPLLVKLDHTYPFRELHALVDKTARGYDIHVIDLLPSFLGHDGPSLWDITEG